MAADAAFRLLRELRSGLSKCPSEGSKIDFVHGIRVACDTNLIGIDSDFRIHARLRRIDLQHGEWVRFAALHGPQDYLDVPLIACMPARVVSKTSLRGTPRRC